MEQMEVIEMGDIGDRYNPWCPEDHQLPERGIIISATKEEIQKLGNLLYRKVEIKEEAK